MTEQDEPKRDSIASEMNASLDGMDKGPGPQDLIPAEGDEPRFHHGKIAGVSGKDVFIELGPHLQGVIPLDEFDARRYERRRVDGLNWRSDGFGDVTYQADRCPHGPGSRRTHRDALSQR